MLRQLVQLPLQNMFSVLHLRPLNLVAFLHSSRIFGDCKNQSTLPTLFELNDDDLEETFICGWGPGGQAINKTANCVRLKHIPTGISVKCQDGRDLQLNRIIARKRLVEQLDKHFNGEESKIAQRRKVAQAKENNRFSRAKRRLEMKAAFKKKCFIEEVKLP